MADRQPDDVARSGRGARVAPFHRGTPGNSAPGTAPPAPTTSPAPATPPRLRLRHRPARRAIRQHAGDGSAAPVRPAGFPGPTTTRSHPFEWLSPRKSHSPPGGPNLKADRESRRRSNVRDTWNPARTCGRPKPVRHGKAHRIGSRHTAGPGRAAARQRRHVGRHGDGVAAVAAPRPPVSERPAAERLSSRRAVRSTRHADRTVRWLAPGHAPAPAPGTNPTTPGATRVTGRMVGDTPP